MIKALLSLICFGLVFPCQGAVRQNPNGEIKELQVSLSILRNELSNQTVLLRTFEEKIANQETIIESLMSQLDQERKVTRELLKSGVQSLEVKLAEVEKTVRNATADLRNLHKHASETSEEVAKAQSKVGALEKTSHTLASDVEHMRTAVGAVMEAIGAAPAEKVYQVKHGDTLGEIAVKHHISVKTLKELNRLDTDIIREGQKLKLPQL